MYWPLLIILLSQAKSNRVGVLDVLEKWSWLKTRLPSSPEQYYATPDMIQFRGYGVEIHEVVTRDGYVLQLHRIVVYHRMHCNVRKKPVLLQHGVFDSSSTWIVSPTNRSLAYRLADSGYDVWLGNSRGNFYSRRHVKLDPRQHQFWDYSWDEMGAYDVPASINYILATTGHERLVYIGHSLGCAIFFIAMVVQPELNDKIDVMIALAPSVSQAHVRSPLALMTPFIDEIMVLFKLNGPGLVFANGGPLRRLQEIFCERSYLQATVCRELWHLFMGRNPENFDLRVTPIYNSHFPAGQSINTFLQFVQNFKAGQTFRAYDYGSQGNWLRYGTKNPPAYNLKLVTAPVVIFWGQNDFIASPKDVAWLASNLANVQASIRAVDPKFNHFDFIVGSNVNCVIYDHLLSIIPPPL